MSNSESITVLKSESVKRGPYIYKMTSKIRGFAYIFNNEKFCESEYNREGSGKDAVRLEKVFNQMGYETEVWTDFSSEQIHQTLKDVTEKQVNKRKLQDHDSFVAIFLSHGGIIRDRYYILSADCKLIKVNQLINYFENDKCRQLIKKPKMFFFNTCHGDIEGKGVLYNDSENEEEDEACSTGNDALELRPNVEDFIISFASVEDYVSVRDPTYGSWYASILSHALEIHAKDKDLEMILKIVDEEVSEKFGKIEIKQSTEWTCKGWKKCLYFNPGLSE